MDLMEGVGESSSPPPGLGSFVNNHDMRNEVYNRLIETANEEAISNPKFHELLDAHFNRFPPSYTMDINLDKVEDVLLHQKVLARAKDPAEKRPVFHIRFMEIISSRVDDDDDDDGINLITHDTDNVDGQLVPVHKRLRDTAVDFEPSCSKLGGLNLDVRKNGNDTEDKYVSEELSKRQDDVHIHEVIFSTVDKPKLLSQLSALLSDLGLNIREAHVFSTTDGYSLDVFVVDGWPVEETDDLCKAMEQAIARSEGSWSGTSHSDSAVQEASSSMEAKSGDGELDRRLLKIRERIGSGACGDLHRGAYLGQDVAVKVLRSEHLTAALKAEFTQEVAILREVRHTNVVRFIGACTKAPDLCVVTEYMPGGSLYDYLQKNSKTTLKVSDLLKFAIDVCKGMEYLHQNNIIHRDLKTANLLMDTNKVVKVADFGVARFQDQTGVMTAETGTYRWMAPEVINHLPYDHKVDVFSFAIVLWELLTSKIPYDTMNPIQAALGVRQGLRPEVPENTNPKLVNIMQRCWEADPTKRPSFSEIAIELQSLLEEVQET